VPKGLASSDQRPKTKRGAGLSVVGEEGATKRARHDMTSGEREMTTAANHHGIVVGVDGSSASKAAVAWAARYATWRKVPLTLVHVLLPPATMTWPEVPLPPGFQQWQEAEGRDIIARRDGHRP
jgi:hypothetical protein